jgi:hypothetical protein
MILSSLRCAIYSRTGRFFDPFGERFEFSIRSRLDHYGCVIYIRTNGLDLFSGVWGRLPLFPVRTGLFERSHFLGLWGLRHTFQNDRESLCFGSLSLLFPILVGSSERPHLPGLSSPKDCLNRVVTNLGDLDHRPNTA